MELIIKDQVTAALDQLGAAKKHHKAIGEAMGLAVVGLTIRSFNDPSVRATPWAPLKESTIAAKMKEGTSTAILKRHVVLARSWRITQLAASHVRVGTDRFYGYFHQFGSKRAPARPMLPIIGGPGNAEFTPLALTRMISVAKTALAGLLLPKKSTPPKSS